MKLWHEIRKEDQESDSSDSSDGFIHIQHQAQLKSFRNKSLTKSPHGSNYRRRNTSSMS